MFFVESKVYSNYSFPERAHLNEAVDGQDSGEFQFY